MQSVMELLHHWLCSLRLASHSINLADQQSEEDDQDSSVRSSVMSQASVPQERISSTSRWRHKFHQYWLRTVQRWPMVSILLDKDAKFSWSLNLGFILLRKIRYLIYLSPFLHWFVCLTHIIFADASNDSWGFAVDLSHKPYVFLLWRCGFKTASYGLSIVWKLWF